MDDFLHVFSIVTGATAIPTFIHIFDGKLHDVNVLNVLVPETGALYVMDRGYLDFKRLHAFHQASAFFVTRAKSNMDARRVYSAPSDRGIGIMCDQIITLNGYYTSRDYPTHLRRIRYKNPETGKATTPTILVSTSNSGRR